MSLKKIKKLKLDVENEIRINIRLFYIYNLCVVFCLKIIIIIILLIFYN